MSGPKLSEAEIERMRQEQLERERQEFLRQLREAQSIYRQACDKIGDVKRYSLSLLDQVDIMYRTDAKIAADAVLANLRVIPIGNGNNIHSYQMAADSMTADAEKAIALLNQNIAGFLSRSKTDQKFSKSDAMHQSFQSVISLKTDPIDVHSIDFKSNYDQAQLHDKIGNVLTHYQWLNFHGQTDQIRQFADKAAKHLQNLLAQGGKLKHLDLISSVQAIINEEADLVRRENEKAALYDDYATLATVMNIVPKVQSDFADVQALKKAISDLDSQYRKKDEMDYIADQINDAMISLGYGIVTSGVLTRKDRSEMDYSLYQADDQTGIAIYTDQSGAVMMRMTVLGNDDVVTDADRDFSLQRQIDFCAGHADIVNALAERGVYLKQKSYLAPDRKHTYKVNMKTTGTAVHKDANGQTVLMRSKVDRRKRRRANKKKMRTM